MSDAPAHPLLPWLRLVRAPAVFSALGDPLAGMLAAGGELPPRRAGCAAAAAAALYLAGMALNDLADRHEDARDRPERPIPSGAVSAAEASAFGAGLLGVGVLAAHGAGAGRSGAALAAAVVAYDFALKRSHWAGPAGMGACRALSFVMGAEAAGGARGVRRSRGGAALLGLYVAGITVLARGETGRSERRTVRIGAGLGFAALSSAALRGGRRGAPWAMVAGALAAPAAVRAHRDPCPESIGPAVGAAIRAIPALDAALAAPRAPLRAAALALPLLLLARWGRRLIPIT
jgi:4-hydroxybenzoate polyprenyltransferase